jgi:4'-phosphopantetheinyl transferase
MTADELCRADALRSEQDRRDFLATHALARLCASRVLGRGLGDVTVVQRCTSYGGPHGRPSIAEAPALSVTFAHTRGYVAAAASPSAVAVDVERVPSTPIDLDLFRRAMTPPELRVLAAADDPQRLFSRQWVRKECLIKLGLFQLDDFPELELPVGDDARGRWNGWRHLDWEDEGRSVVGCAVGRTRPRLELVSGVSAGGLHRAP